MATRTGPRVEGEERRAREEKNEADGKIVDGKKNESAAIEPSLLLLSVCLPLACAAAASRERRTVLSLCVCVPLLLAVKENSAAGALQPDASERRRIEFCERKKGRSGSGQPTPLRPSLLLSFSPLFF
jgi:hypothetical protein